MEFTVPTIETERLILRPLTIDDAEAAFEWTGDERVAKYMIYSTHESIETTKEWLNTVENLENEMQEKRSLMSAKKFIFLKNGLTQ